MTYLNKPIIIGEQKLSNRIVLPPMATGKGSSEGTISQTLLDFYEKEVESVGLVIIEHCYINPGGKAHRGQVSIADDSNKRGFQQLVEIIHSKGAKAIMQISHAGSATGTEVTGREAVGPSSVLNPAPHTITPLSPREMTLSEIDDVINDFCKAAERAIEYGFDGVELHCAHGYLLNQFYSPLTNHRTDKYCGSSLEGRIRLSLEIIEKLRNSYGNKFLLAIRLGGYDYMESGTTLEDSAKVAMMLEKAGVDLLDISGGLCGPNNPKDKNGQGYFKEVSKTVKENVEIPVILTGGITEWQMAETLLQEAYADLIGVGRAMLKNPMWAKNAMEAMQK